MAPNCNGMQISRAHYDDNKNRELMNLNVKVTNENLKKAIRLTAEKEEVKPVTNKITVRELESNLKKSKVVAEIKEEPKIKQETEKVKLTLDAKQENETKEVSA